LPARGVTPGRDDLTGRLGGRYPSFIAPMSPCVRPKPSSCLGFLLVHAVFAGCCQPLLGDGPSRRYLCDPCVGARTHTPPRSSAAPVRYFTEDTGLTPRETGSTRGFTPTQQLRWGAVYRGCSHSITFGLLRSLDLQVAPTAAPKGTEPPGLSHHAEPGRLPDPGSGVASCPTRTTDTAGLSPAGSQPCRLLPPAHGLPTFFTDSIRPSKHETAWAARRVHQGRSGPDDPRIAGSGQCPTPERGGGCPVWTATARAGSGHSS
jgi:hypothetical protein